MKLDPIILNHPAQEKAFRIDILIEPREPFALEDLDADVYDEEAADFQNYLDEHSPRRISCLISQEAPGMHGKIYEMRLSAKGVPSIALSVDEAVRGADRLASLLQSADSPGFWAYLDAASADTPARLVLRAQTTAVFGFFNGRGEFLALCADNTSTRKPLFEAGDLWLPDASNPEPNPGLRDAKDLELYADTLILQDDRWRIAWFAKEHAPFLKISREHGVLFHRFEMESMHPALSAEEMLACIRSETRDAIVLEWTGPHGETEDSMGIDGEAGMFITFEDAFNEVVKEFHLRRIPNRDFRRRTAPSFSHRSG